MSAIGRGLDPVGTLGELFLRSERVHNRPFALQGWRDGKQETVPDWRLHRQVLRFAIYLRERADVGPGDRVAVVAPLGPRSLVVEWGALLIGATAAVIEPGDAEARAGADAIDATVFEESESWSQALDLGGTLDTAERAQSIRAGARALDPSAPALSYLEGTNGTRSWGTLSHEDAMARVRQLWLARAWREELSMPRGEPDLAARLMLYACVGHGRTRGTFAAAKDDFGGMERRNP
jgi:hypothetical protein